MASKFAPAQPASSEITPEPIYRRRREFLKKAGLFSVTAGAWGSGLAALASRGSADPPPEPPANPWEIVRRGQFGTDETPTDFGNIATYNNFYELGLAKSDPAKNGGALRTKPWTVSIEGEVKKPQVLDLETIVGWFGLEERVYRMRCVEAWSMVIPWLGFPLVELVKRLEPTSRAKYVVFETLFDAEQLPGQKQDSLPWPYIEGLRMDEATNPLTMMAVGLYAAPLLPQNGAPLRLVVPWKYGFKSIKSIVRITFSQTQPTTTWNFVRSNEYGFYANVNPGVAHPRWSQATERRIGEWGRRDTLMFNGYGEHVAHLYDDLDLTKQF